MELAARKRKHLEVCLQQPVDYQRLRNGFERFQLRYSALPELDLEAIELSTPFLDRKSVV